MVLMPEVADAGEDHGHAALVGGGDDLGITNRATRLDCSGGTGFGGGNETVGEGEEGITADDAAPQRKTGLASLPDGNA